MTATFGSATFIACLCIYAASETIVRTFRERADADLLVALETGPLQFARLDSADLATRHMARLLEQVLHHNPRLLAATIASGPEFNQVYATWSAPRYLKTSCSSVQRSIIPYPDRLYPFAIDVTYDSCLVLPEIIELRTVCLSIGLLGFAAALSVAAVGAWPVVRSLRIADRVLSLSHTGGGSASTLVETISFQPLHQLTVNALDAKRLQTLAAVAQAVQMIAHDLRKPFSTMRAGLQVLRKTSTFEEMQNTTTRLTTTIESSVMKMNGMLDDLLNIGRPIPLSLSSADPKDLVATCVAELSLDRQPGVELMLHFSHTRSVNCDRSRIDRVLLNLAENAVQAMRGKGRLSFVTMDAGRGHDPAVVLRVSNTNSSVDRTDLPRLFEPFYTKGKKGGTGLGLAIVAQIVEAHAGRIWCDPDHADGVSFIFELPASSTHDTKDHTHAAPESMDQRHPGSYHYANGIPSHGSDDRRGRSDA